MCTMLHSKHVYMFHMLQLTNIGVETGGGGGGGGQRGAAAPPTIKLGGGGGQGYLFSPNFFQ